MRRFIFNILNSTLTINFNPNIALTKILAAIRKILSLSLYLSLTSTVKTGANSQGLFYTGAVWQVHIGGSYINLSENIFCFTLSQTLSQTAQRSANRNESTFLILLGCAESGIVPDETLFFCFDLKKIIMISGAMFVQQSKFHNKKSAGVGSSESGFF